MKNPYLAFAALIGLAALPPAFAGAAWLDLARNSTLQLVGRCDSRSSRWEQHQIYSYCEVTVLRTVHGTPDPGLVVRQRGGEVDGIRAADLAHVAAGTGGNVPPLPYARRRRGVVADRSGS
jgi:hypothetical protein